MPTVGGGGFTAAEDGPIPVPADSSRATPAAAVPLSAADLLIEASSENAGWRPMVSQKTGRKNQNGSGNGPGLFSVCTGGELAQFCSKREQISGKTVVCALWAPRPSASSTSCAGGASASRRRAG